MDNDKSYYKGLIAKGYAKKYLVPCYLATPSGSLAVDSRRHCHRVLSLAADQSPAANNARRTGFLPARYACFYVEPFRRSKKDLNIFSPHSPMICDPFVL